MRTSASTLAILAASSVAFAGVESLRERSPFVPPSAPQQADATNALSSLELTGILSVGGKPLFSVRDASTGRGFWLGLGETQEGLTVRSYDAASSSVVLEGRGASRKIVIREARVATAPPRPPVLTAPLPSAQQPAVTRQVAAAPPPKAAPATDPKKQTNAGGRTNEEAERDARLLVSDLMEISIQERKRYEENQRRTAAGLPRLDPEAPSPAP